MRFIRRLLNALAGWRRRFVVAARGVWQRNRPAVIVTGLILLFLVIYFLPRIVVLVNDGEAAAKFRRFGGGVVEDRVYGEGIHVIFPWDHMRVYNMRVQQRDHTVELLTRNGLTVKFELTFLYYPEYDMLGVLHKRVGPDYVDKIVIPELVSVLRTYVGRFTAEEVYTTQRAFLDRIFSTAIENLTHSYIVVNRVIIRTIELPPLIQLAVEEKIQQRHIAESYEFRLLKEQKEAKRKEIEAQGLKAYNDTVAESLSENILRWKGIEATQEIATSENSKVIVVGNGDQGLPIILGAGGQ